MRVEATAGGGMVTVVINGAKQVQSLKIDPEVVSKDDVEMLQDLILAAINDAQRKADEAMSAADGRHDGRPEDPRPVLMSRPDPLTQAHRAAAAAARHRRQERAAARVSHPQDPARGVERLADAMRDVKERVTYCSVCNNITDADPCSFCTHPARDHRIICVVEEPQNVTAIEKTRDFKGRLSRADGRAVAAAGRRPGRPEDQGAADARRQPAASRK